MANLLLLLVAETTFFITLFNCYYMSTIIVAFIIIGSIVAITWFLVSINKRQTKKKREQLLHRFSQLGTEYNLSYASQEVLKERVIGLDGVNRKLLVLEETNGQQSYYIIDLEEVKNCTVNKIYSSGQGSGNQKSMDNPLFIIALQFDFKDKRPPVQLPFYDHLTNHVFETAELEEKAKDWEAILSKMLAKEAKRIA